MIKYLNYAMIGLDEISSYIKNNMSDSSCFPTQPKVSIFNIQKYINKLHNGEIAPPIKICGDLIIEGHHRYIAGCIFGLLPQSIEWNKPFSIQKGEWSNLILDDVEW